MELNRSPVSGNAGSKAGSRLGSFELGARTAFCEEDTSGWAPEKDRQEIRVSLSGG